MKGVFKAWQTSTAWKVFIFGDILVRIFRIRAEYGEILIQSKCRKIQTRKTLNTGTFHSVILFGNFFAKIVNGFQPFRFRFWIRLWIWRISSSQGDQQNNCFEKVLQTDSFYGKVTEPYFTEHLRATAFELDYFLTFTLVWKGIPFFGWSQEIKKQLL